MTPPIPGREGELVLRPYFKDGEPEYGLEGVVWLTEQQGWGLSHWASLAYSAPHLGDSWPPFSRLLG